MTFHHYDRVDILAIEREAQRMRAQAAAGNFKALVAWVRTRLHMKQGATHHA